MQVGSKEWTELEADKDNVSYMLKRYIYKADRNQLEALATAIKDIIVEEER